jgi:hypothetical protein
MWHRKRLIICDKRHSITYDISNIYLRFGNKQTVVVLDGGGQDVINR